MFHGGRPWNGQPGASNERTTVPNPIARKAHLRDARWAFVQRGLREFSRAVGNVSLDAGQRPMILYNACTTDQPKRAKIGLFQPKYRSCAALKVSMEVLDY